MNEMLPPPPAALNDALALVYLALNAKEAAAYLETLKTQTLAHEAARNANVGKAEQLATREQVLAEKEALIVSRETSVTTRETEVNAHALTLIGQQQALTADSQKLEEAKAAHAANVQSLAHLKANAEQTMAAAHQALDERERALAQAEAEHAAKVARLKELAA